MREPHEEGHGTLRQDISATMVGLYKRHYGEGPARCRTYLHPELVIVVLGGGYSAAEQTLFEAGKWHEVRQARLNWQDSMQAKFVDVIEELTGREVPRVGARLLMTDQKTGHEIVLEDVDIERREREALAF